MSTDNEQLAIQNFQLVQIPTSLNVVIDHPATSIDEVRRWALANVDTSTRWIIRLNGRNVSEAIIVDQYTYDCDGGRPRKKIFNSLRKRDRYFDTPEEAVADYQSHLPEATARLDAIEQRLTRLQKALCFQVSYIMQGDTHGIYHDALCISVNIAGYEYRKEI